MNDAAHLRLTRSTVRRVSWWSNQSARDRGVLFAFSERLGGVSEHPYAALNLAGHVGDIAVHVDENRARFMSAVGVGCLRERLVTAEQVHGDDVHHVSAADAGRGAYAASGEPPIGSTDALVCTQPDIPLMLCFADCVPVVLIAPSPAVAVVHAGWRGTLAGIAEKSVNELCVAASCAPEEVRAWIGPHIGPCLYEVDDEILSQFVHTFDTVARAESGGLDLGAAVATSLGFAGVDPCNITSLRTCTAETTDRFYSHRAEAGLTGRHGALVCIFSR